MLCVSLCECEFLRLSSGFSRKGETYRRKIVAWFDGWLVCKKDSLSPVSSITTCALRIARARTRLVLRMVLHAHIEWMVLNKLDADFCQVMVDVSSAAIGELGHESHSSSTEDLQNASVNACHHVLCCHLYDIHALLPKASNILQ